MVVVAEEQTAGRGRLGREWLAKGGQGVLMSVLLREEGESEGGIERLTLLAGLAAAEGIERGAGAGLRAELKWPNDVLVGGKKIAGVLVERRRVGEAIYVVVGIGVNVGQGSGDFGVELAGRATSIYQTLGVMVDRLRGAVGLVESLDKWMGNKGLNDDWIEDWKGRCVMLGTSVEAQVQGGEASGGRVVDGVRVWGVVVRDEVGGIHLLRAQTTTLSV